MPSEGANLGIGSCGKYRRNSTTGYFRNLWAVAQRILEAVRLYYMIMIMTKVPVKAQPVYRIST